MRLLVVGMVTSSHTANYLNRIVDSDWEVEVFDAMFAGPPHPETPPLRVHAARAAEDPGDLACEVVPAPEFTTEFAVRARQLSDWIDEYEPDLIHSLAFQQAGCLTDVTRILRGGLPCPWLANSWGSCITMSPRFPGFLERTVSILRGADYFGTECHKEIALARSLGMTAKPVGVWPNVAGLDAGLARSLTAEGPTSDRRSIMVKGALSGIQTGHVMVDALDRAGDALAGYELLTYQTDPRIEADFQRVADRHDATWVRLSSFSANERTHEEMLAAHGRSRCSVALNMSDGMSSSFIEAAACGSYPVHSDTGCGHEAITGGRGATYVSPTDPEEVGRAIRRALTDDDLVDTAATSNYRVAAEFFDAARIRTRILDAYDRIADDSFMEALR